MSVILKRTAELLPMIRPWAPACPDFIAEQAVRFAAIDLAERSRAWRHLVKVDVAEELFQSILTGTIEAQTYDLLFTTSGATFAATTAPYPPVGTEMVNVNGDDYPVEGGFLPGGGGQRRPVAAIHEIEFAEFNGAKLTPVQFTSMNAARSGRPEYITQVSPGIVSLLPFNAGQLSMSVFLKPVADSEYGTDPQNPLFDRFNVIPEHFVTLHGTTLAAGALSRILSIPGEPWSDDKKAMLYRAEFENKLNSAFRWNMRGQQRAPIRTKYQDF